MSETVARKQRKLAKKIFADLQAYLRQANFVAVPPDSIEVIVGTIRKRESKLAPIEEGTK